MNKTKCLLILLFFCNPFLNVFAAVSGNLKQNVSVVNSCIINSTNNLNFGSYVPSSMLTLKSSGNVVVTCTKGDTVSIVPVSGGVSMNGSGGSLNYSLYTDSSFTSLFGTTTYNNYTVNLGPMNIVASLLSNVSFSDCQSLANGTGFFFYQQTSASNSPTNCYLNFGTGTQVTSKAGQKSTYFTCNCNYTPNGSNGVGVATISPTGEINQLVQPTGTVSSLYLDSYYLPLDKTTISSNTYTFASQVNQVKNGLNGVSNSSKTPLTFTYYGQVPINQDLPSGNYIDSVVLQVSF